jgi:hypothetical protein
VASVTGIESHINFLLNQIWFMRHGSVSGISTGNGIDDQRVGDRFPWEVNNFLCFTYSRLAPVSTQFLIEREMFYCPGVKRYKREAHHSHVISVEVKKIRIYGEILWIQIKNSVKISEEISWEFNYYKVVKQNCVQ